MNKLIIRNATCADGAAVRGIAATAMQAFGLVPDFEGLDAALGHIGDGRAGVLAEWVAVLDDRVAGSLVLTRAEVPGLVKLTGFYVDATVRGMGVGRHLLGHAIEQARCAGVQIIDLETWDRMVAAVHLYRSFGWQLVERLDPASGAQWRYRLVLAPAAPAP